MKKVLLLLVFSFGLKGVVGQVMFQKIYGFNNAAAVTLIHSASGYLVAGYIGSSSANGLVDSYVFKINSQGDTIWSRMYGSNQRDYPKDIQPTNDGGYIMTGGIQNIITLRSSLFVIKIDSIGNINWSYTYLPTVSNSDWARAIRQTSDGGYIISGGNNYIGGYSDYSLLKIDSTGNVSWSKAYGSSGYDNSWSFEMAHDGGYLITGNTRNFGIGENDIYLIKTDSLGNIQWSKTYGTLDNEVSFSIKRTLDSGYIIGGLVTYDSIPDQHICLLRIDSTGELIWSKKYEGVSQSFSDVEQTSDSGFIISASTVTAPYNMLLTKTDMTGNLHWSISVGDTLFEYGNNVLQDPDSGFVLLGSRSDVADGINSSAYVVKISATGEGECYVADTSIISQPFYPVSTNPLTNLTILSTVGTILPLTISYDDYTSAVCAVGINEIKDTDFGFRIYPNPTSGSFNISFGELEIGDGILNIYDVTGRLVHEEYLTPNPSPPGEGSTVSLNCAPGIYFVRIGEQTQKLVVQ